MNKLRLTVVVYLISLVGLFLYSYTQVDLSLTLSRLSLWQVIEKAFQYVGYFERPLSTGIYISLLFFLFFSFISLTVFAYKNMLSSSLVCRLVIATAILGTFSYNAFSYDLFNYIFDAKIVTYYHMSPYLHKALDFPRDPMLSFMHWTQRTYPYGPTWLFLTVPLSFLGMQIFLPTFFLFKVLAGVSYIGSVYGISNISKKISPKASLTAVVLFAFCPLVIIEGLVSAHNDMAMIFLTVLSLMLLIDNKNIRSILLLFVSGGVKFVSIMYLPVWLIALWKSKTKEKAYDFLFLVGILLGVGAAVIASLRTNFQPWYFLYVLPFVALIPKRKSIVVMYIVFSFFALLQYIPFLYTGNWNPPIPSLLVAMNSIGVGVTILAGILTSLTNLFLAKKH